MARVDIVHAQYMDRTLQYILRFKLHDGVPARGMKVAWNLSAERRG